MIAPVRDGSSYPLACGGLHGFSGFLKRDFRAHDYFLGRRNMQKFLRDHFVLPEHNALFTDWTEKMKQTHCVRDHNHQPETRNGLRFLPIIPLIGPARAVCYQAEWPHYTAEELIALSKQVDHRAGAILNRLADQHLTNFFIRLLAKLAIWFQKKRVVNFVKRAIANDLTKMRLMRSA